MKILISAYACEPNKGSESGVGWQWVIELARHHETWVLTRDNNEPTINRYLQYNPEYCKLNIHFIYIKVSQFITKLKKGNRGIRLYYIFWQRKAFEAAKEWHKKIHFDLVQHVSFVSYTQPTYMYKLGIPMIWGPLSGGENIPDCIKIDMNVKERILEFIRKLSQSTALITPSIHKTMKCSKYILVATEETKDRIPSKFQNKSIVLPAIGIEKVVDNYKQHKNDNKFRIIMAGRLIYWKAFDIGMKAFLQIVDKYPNVELHILGEGNQKGNLKKLAGQYLDKKIFFEPPVPHDEIYDFYKKFDIFLNTSLRDSGCMVLLEAMSSGLPVVYLDVCGPKIIGEGANAFKIAITNFDDTVQEITHQLEVIIKNPEVLKPMRNKMIEAARMHLYSNKYEGISYLYEEESVNNYDSCNFINVSQ